MVPFLPYLLLKSLCNQCLDLVKLKTDDEFYIYWLNLLTYNDLKLWENNNPEYPKSFCLACDNLIVKNIHQLKI